tara:strand:- start:1252 stop:1797 length:546 start_codon:yes stop_codon:yes gene_type:complete
MATAIEEASQTLVEWIGGWSAGDEVTGSAEDAKVEAEAIVETTADARGWTDAELTEAANYIDAASSRSDDADDFWADLATSWPESLYPDQSGPAGWAELGDTWDSYSGWSTAVFSEATEVVKGAVWVPDFAELAKAVGVGAGVGFGLSLFTDLNANLGIGLGGGLAGLWNWSNQRNQQTLG